MSLTKEDRQTLSQTLKVLEQFRTLDSEMQMPQAVTLLTIALNEGISLTDLTEKTSQATSSASRNVARLILSPSRREAGAWISAEPGRPGREAAQAARAYLKGESVHQEASRDRGLRPLSHG